MVLCDVGRAMSQAYSEGNYIVLVRGLVQTSVTPVFYRILMGFISAAAWCCAKRAGFLA
jgi:hypothetical protein